MSDDTRTADEGPLCPDCGFTHPEGNHHARDTVTRQYHMQVIEALVAERDAALAQAQQALEQAGIDRGDARGVIEAQRERIAELEAQAQRVEEARQLAPIVFSEVKRLIDAKHYDAAKATLDEFLNDEPRQP